MTKTMLENVESDSVTGLETYTEVNKLPVLLRQFTVMVNQCKSSLEIAGLFSSTNDLDIETDRESKILRER